MKGALATLRTALHDSLANRSSFWFQVTLMIANDVTWLLFWVLFFDRVGEVRGWTMDDLVVLFSIVLTAAGIVLGLLANARQIGRLSSDGELDETLVLPVSPLPHILSKRIDPANLGDLAFGPALFAIAGNPTPERTALFVYGSLAGAAVLLGFLVACGSLTFFVGGRGEQADLGFNAILILASYPIDFFGGITKALLYTAVPAAFVSGLPANLVRNFDAQTAALLGVVAAGFLALGSVLFGLGLRRYSSGSLWVR
jgi:ABC-2 type transport system permease protein